MPLVGEVICRVRNIAGDPCQTLAQPTTPSLAIGAAGTLSGTLFGIETWTNQFGETVGSAEVTIAGLASKAVTITSAPPLGATGGRFYYSSTAGTEQQYILLGTTGADTVGSTGQAIFAGVPPYRPSAYIPDSDGDIVGAYEMYRWLNAGMNELGRLAGGILDQTGIAIDIDNFDIVIPGYWLKVLYVWYNGWLLLPEQQSYLWRQSAIYASPGITTIWKNSAQQVMGMWPGGSTTPASTTLSAPMLITDVQCSVGSQVGFTAPGMCKIDNEIMSFSGIGVNVLSHMTRAYGGTVVAAHSSGAAVSNLLFRILGRRLPAAIAIGAAATTLDLPGGWDAILDYYLLSKFKQTEQNVDEASKLMQEFVQKAQTLNEDSESELPGMLSEQQARDGFVPVYGRNIARRSPNAWIRPRPQRPSMQRQIPMKQRMQRGGTPPEEG